MSRTQRGLKTVLKEIARSSERSSLFWWMFEHHDQLVTAAQGQRMRWAPLCERFSALGLADATGKPASIRTARETWRQVRASVASARAHAAAKKDRRANGRVAGLVNPSRMSPNWRPEVVPATVPVRPVARGGLPAATDAVSAQGRPTQSPALPSTPEEVKEAALRDLDEMDWHLKLQ